MDRVLEDAADLETRFEVTLRRASLMGTVLDRPTEALEEYRNLLERPISNDMRNNALSAVADLVRTEDADGKFLLDVATLLESYWSITSHANDLIGLYENIFDLIVETDKIRAAEVMSRMASSYQASDRLRSAFVTLVRALSCNPDREDIFVRLERLAEKLDGLHELAAIYEDDFENAFGQRHKALLGR